MSNSPLGGRAPTSASSMTRVMPSPGLSPCLRNPGYLRTLEYSARWGIEPMFSDFKSRGFGIEDTQLPLRANDDETQAPRKFRLEGAGELSRGHAQQSCRD